MKLPPSVGQKKSKAIEQMLTELGLGMLLSTFGEFSIVDCNLSKHLCVQK